MEADLDRYYHGLDLREHWRRDARGRRRLTLRQLKVRIDHLPPESATAVATGSAGWTVGDFLIADLYNAWTGKAHPADPRLRKNQDAKASVTDLRAARERSRRRREQLGMRGSVLRKG